MAASDPLLITDQLASPIAENHGGSMDYAGAGDTASDLEYALTELDRHAPGYIAAQLYANGQSPELFFLSEKARQDVAAFIDGFQLNFAGLVPATIADRMILNAIDGLDRAKDVEDAVLEANSLYTWLPEAIQDMLVDGDHYIITLPGDGDDSDDENATPVMVPSNAVDTRLFYDSETERIAEMGIRRWVVGRGNDQAIRANLWYPDRVERFIRTKDDRWTRYSNEEVGLGEVDDAEFIPFAHLRTRAPYGRPIHRDAYGAQDMIVKAVMTLMAGVEFTGWPQRYALHEEALAGQTLAPTRTAAPADGSTPKPRLRSGPGTVWDVFAKAVGAFPAADLTKLTEVVELAVKSMSQTTRIPMHYFDPLGAGSSGEARIAADQPVKAAANKQRGNAGRAIRESVIQVGRYLGDTVEPEAVWAPDPVISEKTWWETANIKAANGVPRTQILLEAGYTPDQIEEFALENRLNAPDVPEPTTVQTEPVEDDVQPPEGNQQ